MAYNELVKNFSRIRDYMREFYVYGFKSREEFTKKSARSYDDERRRMESWLGDYMQFRQTPGGKNVFISIDSRVSSHNPLYKAWKTKSFTDGDITLHFILFDILSNPEENFTISEIMEKIDEYLVQFTEPRMFDESTVRKKLKEYTQEGIIVAEKAGRTVRYHSAKSVELPDAEILDFFSETAPCGVVGSFLLDKTGCHDKHFVFKHHYITGAMDSGVVCDLFIAMREKRSVTLESVKRQKNSIMENHVIPLRIMISVQSGRQYLIAYSSRMKRITSFRVDNIVSVKFDDVSDRFDELRRVFNGMLPHMWGISTQSRSDARMEHVEFIVKYEESEGHIPRRLEREKRCGHVEHIDHNTSRFTADVYDAGEMIPWIRTFICRITYISFSNKELEKQFKNDIQEMYKLYGMEGDCRDLI